MPGPVRLIDIIFLMCPVDTPFRFKTFNNILRVKVIHIIIIGEASIECILLYSIKD